jgi:hypothetical protein
MGLVPNSRVGRAVAEHILTRGTQAADAPPGVSVEAYRRALGRLEKIGVLRRWRWEVDGMPYEPKSHTAGALWLPGERWQQYVADAERSGIAFDPLGQA